jgi:conjugative transposon TraM protein
MEEKKMNHSPQFARKRKFLLVIPILVYPFFTFLLYSLGIIGNAKAETNLQAQKGFNINLPNPTPAKDSNWNKLKFYEEADRDSAKYQSLLKNDPYFQFTEENDSFSIDKQLSSPYTLPRKEMAYSYDPYPAELPSYKDPNEAKVYRKLAQLDRELTRSEVVKQNSDAPFKIDNNEPASTIGVDHLESMMQQMQSPDLADAELTQLNGMLEKILDIQHPDRIKGKLKTQSETNRQQVFPVSVNSRPDRISLLQSNREKNNRLDTIRWPRRLANNSFYGIDLTTVRESKQNAIRAAIPTTQTLVTGSTVKLHLTDDVYINGFFIPKGQAVFGLASLNGERIIIEINSIGYKNNILPVALSVYDLNGMEGIYMPGAITREVAKQSTDQAIQSLSIASLDPSIGAQAASAGIQAAKSLIGRKAKLVKVTVRAGYEVLLKDTNQRSN